MKKTYCEETHCQMFEHTKKQIREDAIDECKQIVQKIKADYIDSKFSEEKIPINYGTICGIIISLEQLKKKNNDTR